MTGSLTVKNGKYYAVLNVYENGKRKKKWINSGLPEKGNKKKAAQFLRKKLDEYELREGIVRDDVLFSDYIRLWLEHIARSVDEVTLQGYQSLANSQILPYFDEAKIQLQKVDCNTIQKYMDDKYLHGRIDGKGGLSPRSLRLHKNIISQALDMAVQRKLLLSNPCQYVVLPQNIRYESSFYNEQQLQTLFHAIKGDTIEPLVRITALYGLRRSELLGLQWDSIDFENNRLTIRHTVTKVTKVVAKDKTKNATSYRSFPLTPEAAEIFRNAQQLESKYRTAFGREYTENTFVFKWPDGKPFSPDYVTRHFRNLLAKHNLPHIRFHELRHSCASVLINMGFTLKDVQDWLGHSDIKMTANIYSHLDVARKNSMANSLNEKLMAAGGR